MSCNRVSPSIGQAELYRLRYADRRRELRLRWTLWRTARGTPGRAGGAVCSVRLLSYANGAVGERHGHRSLGRHYNFVISRPGRDRIVIGCALPIASHAERGVRLRWSPTERDWSLCFRRRRAIGMGARPPGRMASTREWGEGDEQEPTRSECHHELLHIHASRKGAPLFMLRRSANVLLLGALAATVVNPSDTCA